MIMTRVGHDSATKTTIIGKAFSYEEQDIVLKHKEQLLSFTKSQVRFWGFLMYRVTVQLVQNLWLT